MLRFYCKEIECGDTFRIAEDGLYMDDSIWNNCKRFLADWDDWDEEEDCTISLIPVRNAVGELIAYGYQDSEADRELRMIRELKENKSALQFTDIYPGCRKVIIYGCNELAVSFAEYLKAFEVAVSVVGEYWDYFGYDVNYQEINREKGTLVIYAEGIYWQNQDLRQCVLRSVSPEFECIDKIFEANVLKGKISDTVGNFDEFIKMLKDEKEIVILGVGTQSQDTYDLLMEHGIDICAFSGLIKKDYKWKRLLGKPIMNAAEIKRQFHHPIFLYCRASHGALGDEWTECFDYRGYERNKQFFLVRDYTDIPTTNLVHVLHGRKVLLAGDPRLCEMLSDYLNVIENGEVDVQYTALSEKVSVEEDRISCLVYPTYVDGKTTDAEKKRITEGKLSEMGFTDYTSYFMGPRYIALIEVYLNRNNEKYTVPQLTPKGILLGRIPGFSGNTFFRGIMDGHPEVLLIPYSFLNHNLFYICVCLAGVDSNKLLQKFWEMYDEESGDREQVFPNQDKFDAKMRNLLKLKSSFTSQELFVMFHMAYAEMFTNKPILDVSELIIYWEPHFISRNAFPFFALWLEDERINGHTIVLRRNQIVKAGSGFQRWINNPSSILFMNETELDRFNYVYSHWSELKLRFEDIKVNPKTELMKVCRLMDIAWSDNLLRTTQTGKPHSFHGVADYDLRPVFTEYPDSLSSFDRFRISIASGPYQKRYGYPYYDCTKFSRSELQEIFLKPFLFEEKSIFAEALKDMLVFYRQMRSDLWKVRKHMVLDDIKPEFPPFDLKGPAQNANDDSVEPVKSERS